jgi:pullulanase/glycogen debranching enzyme
MERPLSGRRPPFLARQGRPGHSSRGWLESSDLYEKSGRPPYCSISFITSHDGFTLSDMVS